MQLIKVVNQLKCIIKVINGKVFCTSLYISNEFDIMHKHILEKINNLIADIPTVKNQFIESEFTNERNRKYPSIVTGKQIGRAHV